MKAIIFILLFPALSFGGSLAPDPDPDISWVDGNIIFRVGYVPSALESVLASSGLKFSNFSNFFECAKSTSTTQDKIDDLPPSETKNKASKIKAIKDVIAAK